MFEAVASPYLVGDDGTFRIKHAASAPPKDSPGKKKCKEKLAKLIDEISDLQRILYAHDKYAVLLIGCRNPRPMGVVMWDWLCRSRMGLAESPLIAIP